MEYKTQESGWLFQKTCYWEKHGSIFKNAYGGSFFDMPEICLIITRRVGDRLFAMINGILDYWGEHSVHAATSTDLVNWEPLLDENKE